MIKEIEKELEKNIDEYLNACDSVKSHAVNVMYAMSQIESFKFNKAIIENKIVSIQLRNKTYNIIEVSPYYDTKEMININLFNPMKMVDLVKVEVEYYNEKGAKLNRIIECNKIKIQEKN